MSEVEESEKGRQKQLNLGFVDGEVAKRIEIIGEQMDLVAKKAGLSKLGRGQFIADVLDVFGETLTEWVTSLVKTPLNQDSESWTEARKRAEKKLTREKLQGNANKIFKGQMVEMHRILKPKIDEAIEKALEEQYG